MSDSEELKRLRADLESVNGIRVRYQSDIRLEEIRNDLFDKIAKLEAAADPWRDAREAILLHMESGGHKVKEVARYARHLEDEGVGQQMKIAGLQDENARLTARVAELESACDPEDDEDLASYNAPPKKIIGKVEIKPIADMRPPFMDGEPEFTPAVLKRADEVAIGDVILGGGMIRTVTEAGGNHPNRRIIRCDSWGVWLDNRDLVAVLHNPLVEAKPTADMQPPFEDPIVGVEPVLEPARVLATAVATAVEALAIRRLAAQTRDRLTTLCNNAKPYPLKKGGSDAK